MTGCSLLPYLHVAGVGFAFRQSNFTGQLIVIIIFLGSIVAWTLMITKMRELSRARNMSRRFLLAYRNEAHPAALFLKRQKFSDSPLYVIYEKTCQTLGAVLESRGADANDLFMGAVGSSAHKLENLHVSSVRNMTERTMADEAFFLENNMGLIAISASTAPLLGLLGTVWGVMDAFGGMVVGGSAMLSAVAPGISGALLTTVVGLLVAIPSTVGYNLLSEQIRRLDLEMDNFSQELISDVELHYHQ